ncbi:malic enzyme [Russula ochroleuca]|uniref:Malic enzyme n=1 Tax=Russula ochroleuca TaxID=152965 RepID=A0A9P5N1K3_9AGAM|nr:malic enzyme [Russula ochroleuca]
MTVILTPYWSDGTQRLKAEPQPPQPPPRGHFPAAYDDALHAARCLAQLRSKDKPIEKYIYLSQLKHANENLFYRLCLAHMAEFTPIIYTPTVGDACLQHSHIFRRPEGLYISIKDKGKVGEILNSWPHKSEARISVVTDGSRILGLGDLGVNGMPISIGKLSLYIAGAGIRPSSTIPICLDLGTNNQEYLDDPLYLGLRQSRVSDEVMTEFMKEFMFAMSRAFPKLLVQFEDFSTEHAFYYLDSFRHRYPVFNDDVQGTGAVVLSGFLNAAKLSSGASGQPLTSHRILFLGAGSAGVGVAMQLLSFFKLQGLTQEEARHHIYLVDSKGLIFDSRGPMADHKKYFSRKDYNGPPLTNLTEIIEYVKPTALFGLSTIKGAFNQDVIEAMAAHNARPIIFPLSNPVRLSECEFDDALRWTNGRVLFASGSPFPDALWEGKVHYAGQGNNMYIFPGLGLGSILCRASAVTDAMVEASSLGLADSLDEDERDSELLYPRLNRIREISAYIAMRVIRKAQEEVRDPNYAYNIEAYRRAIQGVDRNSALRSLGDAQLLTYVTSKMWNP